MIFKSAAVFADAAKYVDNFHVVDTQSEQGRRGRSLLTETGPDPDAGRLAWLPWLPAMFALLNVSGHKCKLGACSYCIIKGAEPQRSTEDRGPRTVDNPTGVSKEAAQGVVAAAAVAAAGAGALARRAPRPLCITFKSCDISTHFKVIRLPGIQAERPKRQPNETSLNITRRGLPKGQRQGETPRDRERGRDRKTERESESCRRPVRLPTPWLWLDFTSTPAPPTLCYLDSLLLSLPDAQFPCSSDTLLYRLSTSSTPFSSQLHRSPAFPSTLCITCLFSDYWSLSSSHSSDYWSLSLSLLTTSSTTDPLPLPFCLLH